MNNDFYEDEDLVVDKKEDKKADIQAIIYGYLIHWKWFVVSVIICLFCAWFYLRYARPVYSISSTVLLNPTANGGGRAASGGDGYSSSLESMFEVRTYTGNIVNVLNMLKSKSLVKKVVMELGLHINYETQGAIGATENYNNSPIVAYMNNDSILNLRQGVHLEVLCKSNNKISVTGATGAFKINKDFDNLPARVETPVGDIMLYIRDSVNNQIGNNTLVKINITPPIYIAKGYLGAMTITPIERSTIINITLTNTNKRRGEDFLNKLIEVYNRVANEDKNEVVRKTAVFIDERIEKIGKELGGTEKNIAKYKQESRIVSLGSEAGISTSGAEEFSRKQVELGAQMQLLDYVNAEINDPSKQYDIIPANTGISDQSINTIINQYNELVLQRNKYLRTLSATHPTVLNLDKDINIMKASVRASIQNAYKNMSLSKKTIDSQVSKYSSRMANMPSSELILGEIGRQQEIQSSLFLMLLQKREENAIAMSSNINSAKIIDDTLAADAPIAPKRQMIWLTAFIIGLLLPIAAIFLIDLLKYKIEGRADVEKLTNLSVVGDIPFYKKATTRKDSIVVKENDNDVMAEAFRSLRTNLQFFLEDKDKKVILVTSTESGEGKSFVASNLAVSLALLENKTILVGLDIRRPRLVEAFNLSKKEGVTKYLVDNKTNIDSLIQPSGVIENLSLLPSGLIPPNPAELLSRKNLAELIEYLRTKFDYIVLDTAPVGVVSDTLIFSKLADISLYVCRSDYSKKTNLEMMNNFVAAKKLVNTSVVINGVDVSKKKYGYYYGYGRKYSYGYGYGYGYGQEHHKKHNKNFITQIRELVESFIKKRNK